MTMRRGEVWRVRFPDPVGHVQAGERPAVLVQRDHVTPRLPTLLVVPFTSRTKTLAFPATLLVQPDGGNGLTVPSVALGFQMRAIDKRQLITHLGDLDPVTLDQVVALLDLLIH
jgi:mRNA interferase MazF